jgi:hypothetical protein
MKVLKEGKWNNPWSGTYACPTCEAELLVEERDVKPVDYSTGFTCACVVCGHAIKIPDKDLPLRVREGLERKRKYSSSWD